MIDFSLINNLKCVAVALSGGKDSMFLTSNLIEYKKTHDIEVKAINIEHGIRGEESLRDSNFVKKFCEENNIPLLFKSVDCVTFAKDNGYTVEQAGRILRYNVFLNAVSDNFCQAVLTAHHKQDNVESVLFNLFRGSGLKGLCGIDKVAYDGKILRPMLEVDSYYIKEYVVKNNIPYVEDSTNNDIGYTRNYIRNAIVPSLKEKFGNVENAISRFSKLAEYDERYLSQVADNLIEDFGSFIRIKIDCNYAITSRAIIKVLKLMGVKKDFQKVNVDDVFNLITSDNGSSISLPLNVVALKEYDYITFYKREESEQLELPYNFGEINFLDSNFLIKPFDGKDEYQNCKTLKFDGDKIPKNAIFRTRKSGDVFTKFGGGTKKLNDYFTDKKIPKMLRDKIPVLANEKNILFIVGIEISDLIKVDKTTSNVVQCISINKARKS